MGWLPRSAMMASFTGRIASSNTVDFPSLPPDALQSSWARLNNSQMCVNIAWTHPFQQPEKQSRSCAEYAGYRYKVQRQLPEALRCCGTV